MHHLYIRNWTKTFVLYNFRASGISCLTIVWKLDIMAQITEETQSHLIGEAGSIKTEWMSKWMNECEEG